MMRPGDQVITSVMRLCVCTKFGVPAPKYEDYSERKSNAGTTNEAQVLLPPGCLALLAEPALDVWTTVGILTP